MRHLKTFESSDNLWREIDTPREDIGLIKSAVDSFTKGEISRITSLFQPLVGSFGRVQVYCRNFRKLPHNMFRIFLLDPLNVRNVSINNLSRGNVEVIMPRAPSHLVNVDIDWSTHSISIFKSVDDHFLVGRPSTSPHVWSAASKIKWYLCDGFYGLIQLLKIFCQEFSEIKGPFAVRRGEIFRTTYNMFMVLADDIEQSAWVPTIDIAYISRDVPQLIFNTESEVVRRKCYQPASQDELRTLMDQALSGENDRYLRRIEDKTGINLVDALTRALNPID
jgi:hypothetical protein